MATDNEKESRKPVLSKLFLKAVSTREYNEVREFVYSGNINLNKIYRYEGNHYFTPLALIIKHCYCLDIVQSLIALGADLNINSWYIVKKQFNSESTQYVSPLYQAVIELQDHKLTETLLEAGADVNMYTGKCLMYEEEGGSMEFNTKFTCLHHCIMKIKMESVRSQMIRILLEHQADYNIPNDHGLTPLQLSLMEQQTSSISLLVQYGCIGNNLAASVYSPLALQMETDDTNMLPIQIMLNAGYNVRQDDECPDIIKMSDQTVPIYQEVNKWLCKPLSLKLCCRISLRRHLKNKCNPKTLLSLPIPVSLQHYLNLNDICVQS